MSQIKNGGLDQYGAEPFEQQQSGTAGVEGVKDNAVESLSRDSIEERIKAREVDWLEAVAVYDCRSSSLQQI